MGNYETLKEDHANLKALLAKLVVAARANDEVRRHVLSELKCAFESHMRLEEMLLFSQIRGDERVQRYLWNAEIEHQDAEDLLDKLTKMKAGNPDWIHIARRLKSDMERHMEEAEFQALHFNQELVQEEAPRSAPLGRLSEVPSMSPTEWKIRIEP